MDGQRFDGEGKPMEISKGKLPAQSEDVVTEIPGGNGPSRQQGTSAPPMGAPTENPQQIGTRVPTPATGLSSSRSSSSNSTLRPYGRGAQSARSSARSSKSKRTNLSVSTEQTRIRSEADAKINLLLEKIDRAEAKNEEDSQALGELEAELREYTSLDPSEINDREQKKKMKLEIQIQERSKANDRVIKERFNQIHYYESQIQDIRNAADAAIANLEALPESDEEGSYESAKSQSTKDWVVKLQHPESGQKPADLPESQSPSGEPRSVSFWQHLHSMDPVMQHVEDSFKAISHEVNMWRTQHGRINESEYQHIYEILMADLNEIMHFRMARAIEIRNGVLPDDSEVNITYIPYLLPRLGYGSMLEPEKPMGILQKFGFEVRPKEHEAIASLDQLVIAGTSTGPASSYVVDSQPDASQVKLEAAPESKPTFSSAATVSQIASVANPLANEGITKNVTKTEPVSGSYMASQQSSNQLGGIRDIYLPTPPGSIRPTYPPLPQLRPKPPPAVRPTFHQQSAVPPLHGSNPPAFGFRPPAQPPRNNPPALDFKPPLPMVLQPQVPAILGQFAQPAPTAAPPVQEAAQPVSSGQIPSELHQQLLLMANNNNLITNLLVKQNQAQKTSGDQMSQFAIRQSLGNHLPKFDGSPDKWLSFTRMYDESTKSCGYSNTENIMRLQNCLQGKALEVVQSLLSSPDNLDEILRTLQTHFGRPEFIVSAIIKKVVTCSPVTPGRLDSMVEFGVTVRNLVASIISLQQLDHLKNPILLGQLEEKLPAADKMQWARFLASTGKPTDLNSFKEWIEQEVQLAQRFCKPEDKPFKSFGPKENKKKGNGSVFYAHDSLQEEEKKPTPSKASQKKPRDRLCVYCDKHGHKVPSCSDFAKLAISDRWKQVRQRNLCIGCLNTGHAVRVCKSRQACKYDSCSKPHHHLLHSDGKKAMEESSITTLATEELPPPPPPPNAETAVTFYGNHVAAGKSCINLMILPVRIKGKKGAVVNAFAMLDSASTGTFIRQDLLDKLQVKGKKTTVILKTMHPDPVVEPCEIVNLRISPEKGREEFHLNGVQAVEKLPLKIQSVTHEMIRNWPHLQGLDGLSLYENAQPSILVGQDHSYLQTAMQLREGPIGAPIATLTKLGWTLSGPVCGQSQEFSFFISEEQQLAELHRIVKEQFSLDAIGVKVQDLKIRSLEDKRAQKILDDTTQRVGDRWETGLLWRYDKIRYPESYPQAMKRLATQERKMDKDPLFAKALLDKMAEYEEKGYIQKLKPKEVVPHDKAYYLPYFGVRNPNKPKKFRLVFDAAARTHGVSFNDMILPGPDKLTPLLSVLMKFRQRKIAVTADIADMFHRVFIRKEDLPAQRFLFRGMVRNDRPDVYQMKVMIFGSACSPCAAQEVKNRNAKEFQEDFPEAVKAIVERHYVDDYLDSFSTEEEARNIVSQVIEIHAKGGFVIRNWTSNEEAILEAIPQELRAPQHQSLDMEIDKSALTERVLGLHWKPQQDEFTFMPKFHKVPQEVLNGSRMPTKREALSLVMSVYDPLGLLSNFIVTAKIILQQAWKYQIGWDDQLPENSAKAWKNWIIQLQDIGQFRIPRCYATSFMAGPAQLHIFCDASEEAYCAVSYFRIKDEDHFSTALVMAKTRVTPLKYVSMPRLELQAAVLGCRMMKMIISYHERPIEKVHFWTDSKTVMQWLRSASRRFTPFVAHRIGEIQEESTVSDWHWISTKENVADEATRSGNKINWSSSSRWITGPSFLQTPEKEWPKDDTQVTEDIQQAMQAEMKTEFVAICFSDSFMNVERFSNYMRLVRATAYIQRFIYNCRSKEKRKEEFTAMELEDSQLFWYKQVQQEAFSKELSLIKEGRPLPKKSLLKKLSAFLAEDGLLRVEGRIQMAPGILQETANPIILPPRHPFTRLLVMHQHVQCKHIGLEQVVNELRKKFYIPSVRGVVRQIWARCQLCRNRRAYPKPPKMGQLPKERLEKVSRPFTNCGVDYFGPYEVTIGRRHEKRYGCLFTCLSTRAIHLEVACGLSTDSFIMCLIRFMALRGDPKIMYSDNGTNFVGANNELQEVIRQMDQDRLQKFYALRGITWKFIPPRTPHQGGAWERMVRAVKEGLKHCLREKFPREETLRTVFREVQRLVNGHPLTYVAMDPDGEQALTPNHFLWGSSDGSQPMGDFDEKDMLRGKQWRIAMKMAEHFWERWTREYLPTLVRRQKWTDQTTPIKVGDVGVMVEELKPREEWPIGRVVQVFPGEDGIVRSVEFKTKTGFYTRPVHKIGIFSLDGDFGPYSPKSGGTVAEDDESPMSE